MNMTTVPPSAAMMSHVSPTSGRILELGLAFWGSKALLSAVEIGVFSVLAQGPLDAGALRERLGLHPRAARDFFDALVALGMLERTDGRYTNTPESQQFLDRAKPTYVGGILEMANARLYPFWGSLTDGLRTGQAQSRDRAEGDDFEVLYRDPDRLKGFIQAMTSLSMDAAAAIARKFPWENHRTFLDIGTAEGGAPVQIALAHPHLTGIGFDLPPVEPLFTAYVTTHGLRDRLRFHAGDLFTDPFPPADVVLMGHMLHGWDLETKRLLLARAHEALPQGGALIVFDAIIDDERRQNAFGLLMSVNMLIETTGGFDYTGADCREWMQAAGFRDCYVEHLEGPDSMVVGTK
jgi:hypothetical protein